MEDEIAGGCFGTKSHAAMASVEAKLATASSVSSATAVRSSTPSRVGSGPAGSKLAIEQQHDAAPHDDGRERDQGPSVEMQPEDCVAIRATFRNDVVTHLVRGNHASNHGAEDGKTIVTWPRTEHQIERMRRAPRR
jgi:hypothetical protein